MGTYRLLRPEKQANWLQILVFLPLLQTQHPRLTHSSEADYLLWFLLTLCPHYQGTKQMLAEIPLFLPVDPNTLPPNPSLFLSVSSK